MIHAYHIILTTYGFWLPNDPRGSWSDWVRLVAYGKATKVSTRRSVAARPHDCRKRLEAKKALRYPPVSFNGRQALAVGYVQNNPLRDGKPPQRWSFVVPFVPRGHQ